MREEVTASDLLEYRHVLVLRKAGTSTCDYLEFEDGLTAHKAAVRLSRTYDEVIVTCRVRTITNFATRKELI